MEISQFSVGFLGWNWVICFVKYSNSDIDINRYMAGGNSNIFGIFTPKIGEDDSHFDEHIFQLGW